MGLVWYELKNLFQFPFDLFLREINRNFYIGNYRVKSKCFRLLIQSISSNLTQVVCPKVVDEWDGWRGGGHKMYITQ